MSDVIGAYTSDQELRRNLGTRQPESRFSNFAAGVLGMQENIRSAISTGISGQSERTGVFAGRRWVLAPSNGRSQSTYETQPQFEEDA
jgi:hypothetical protein